MFSMFSALGLKTSDSLLRRIPYYASLVFFELLHDSNDGKFVVQLSFKNGLEVSVEAALFALIWLKGPSQSHLCFCLHARVRLLYFIRSMSR